MNVVGEPNVPNKKKLHREKEIIVKIKVPIELNSEETDQFISEAFIQMRNKSHFFYRSGSTSRLKSISVWDVLEVGWEYKK